MVVMTEARSIEGVGEVTRPKFKEVIVCIGVKFGASDHYFGATSHRCIIDSGTSRLLEVPDSINLSEIVVLSAVSC